MPPTIAGVSIFFEVLCMASSEQRVHTRAPFFLLGTGANATPMFAFRDANNPQSIAALVMDISEGGVQILSQAGLQLTGKSFHLELVVSPGDVSEKLDGGEVQWVWSRPEGMYIRSGFVARADTQVLSLLLATLQAADHKVLRCVLHPVGEQALA
jgi:hypothetical protein